MSKLNMFMMANFEEHILNLKIKNRNWNLEWAEQVIFINICSAYSL